MNVVEENKGLELISKRIRKLEKAMLNSKVNIFLLSLLWFAIVLTLDNVRDNLIYIVYPLIMGIASYYVFLVIFKFIKLFTSSKESKKKMEEIDHIEGPKLVVCSKCTLVYPASYTKCLECGTDNMRLKKEETREGKKTEHNE